MEPSEHNSERSIIIQQEVDSVKSIGRKEKNESIRMAQIPLLVVPPPAPQAPPMNPSVEVQILLSSMHLGEREFCR